MYENVAFFCLMNKYVVLPFDRAVAFVVGLRSGIILKGVDSRLFSLYSIK